MPDANFASLWGALQHAPAPTPPSRISSWSWPKSKACVTVLARLKPRVLATGNGTLVGGKDVADELCLRATLYPTRSIVFSMRHHLSTGRQ
jgi:hypothetical protein